MLCVSWTYACSTVLTRKLQGVHFSVVLFFYALCATCITLFLITTESLYKNEPMRILNVYSSDQILFAIGVTLISLIGQVCATIANQNEKSGVITLIGYVGLIYNFMADKLIFHQQFAIVELASVLVLLALNVAVVINRLKGSFPKKSDENIDLSLCRNSRSLNTDEVMKWKYH